MKKNFFELQNTNPMDKKEACNKPVKQLFLFRYMNVEKNKRLKRVSKANFRKQDIRDIMMILLMLRNKYIKMANQ